MRPDRLFWEDDYASGGRVRQSNALLNWGGHEPDDMESNLERWYLHPHLFSFPRPRNKNERSLRQMMQDRHNPFKKGRWLASGGSVHGYQTDGMVDPRLDTMNRTDELIAQSAADIAARDERLRKMGIPVPDVPIPSAVQPSPFQQ